MHRFILSTVFITFLASFLTLTPFTSLASQRSAGKKDTRHSALHGKKGAKIGSHEDWCGEHNVPESLCTRCNPALVPAFKATKDWCAEHGLPESQCLKCNPDLKIVRPPKKEKH